jgi:hypothetical protein
MENERDKTAERLEWLKGLIVQPTGVEGEPSVLEMGFRPWTSDKGACWESTWFHASFQLRSTDGRLCYGVTLKLTLMRYHAPVDVVVGGKSISTDHYWKCAPININDIPRARLEGMFEDSLGLDRGSVLDGACAIDPVDAVYKCVRRLCLALDVRSGLELLDEQKADALKLAMKPFAENRDKLLKRLAEDMACL